MSREGGRARDFCSLAGFRAFFHSHSGIRLWSATADLGRRPGIHTSQWWLWIPGSFALLTPRNDAFQPPPRLLRLHPLKFRQLMPEPCELPLGVVAAMGAADRSGFVPRDLSANMPDQRRHAVGLHRRQQRI